MCFFFLNEEGKYYSNKQAMPVVYLLNVVELSINIKSNNIFISSIPKSWQIWPRARRGAAAAAGWLLMQRSLQLLRPLMVKDMSAPSARCSKVHLLRVSEPWYT